MMAARFRENSFVLGMRLVLNWLKMLSSLALDKPQMGMAMEIMVRIPMVVVI